MLQQLIQNKLEEAKQAIFKKLDEIANSRLKELKQYIALEIDEESITEANSNISQMGRIYRIRRRIRRDSNGRIIVQRNATRSSMKGYRITGKSIRRISAAQRMHKSRMMKRSWATKRRSQLRRTLQRRKMSLQRRRAIGLR